jgi:uroporphyrinogen decarboxylase
MVAEYKRAGAKYVLLHSDGNILPILDMLVDAGIDGLNPLEKRAGIDPVKIRERYPTLILTGGMCNTDRLINGPIERIEQEARELIELGRDGGVIIGSHTISPEIPLQNYAAYHRT